MLLQPPHQQPPPHLLPSSSSHLGCHQRSLLLQLVFAFAALPLTIAATTAESALLEDADPAECDDGGSFAQLNFNRNALKKLQKPIVGSGVPQAHGHVAAASSTQTDTAPPGDHGQHADVAFVSAGRDNHGHSHGDSHGQHDNHQHKHSRSHQHSHQNASPANTRRRRRHSSPPDSTTKVLTEGTEASFRSVATAAGAGTHEASSLAPTTGLTFIQIDSSINETVQEFDDTDGEPSATDGSAQSADAPPVEIATNGDGITIATASAVLHPAPQAQTTIFGIAAPDKIVVASISFVTFALALSVCAMAARHMCHAWQHRRVVQGVRERAEKLRVTHGAELEKLFGLHVPGGSPTMSQPLSPGILMRIQGRVVSESQGSLVAPLSGQNCVIYSASVSHQRHDGIHQPVAFRSESTDFAIELSGSPHIRVAVHSHDVDLFDMVDGKMGRECSLSEAEDTWRAFLLAHCVPGQDASSGVALGRNDSLLDFRESALMQGVEATCIGEIARDRNGKLGIYPWRPSPTSPAKAPHGGLMEFAREDSKRAPALLSQPIEMMQRLLNRGGATSVHTVPKRESLVGRVMVSDHPDLHG